MLKKGWLGFGGDYFFFLFFFVLDCKKVLCGSGEFCEDAMPTFIIYSFPCYSL